MSDAKPVESDPAVTLKYFLESVHPSSIKNISDLWSARRYPHGGTYRSIVWPDLRLHCRECGGERTFRCSKDVKLDKDEVNADLNPIFTCGDCHEQIKQYSLSLALRGSTEGEAYKYGELPPFGIPVPNRVLRLFGSDSKVFIKGRQCENLGYGIGAFAYYRRVVENHKNDLFDEIIKVCETVSAPDGLVEELQQAKLEISFSKSFEKIKAGLPQGLLINGHNPLSALHSALSVGLHNESDQECLAAAQAVRLVLSDLVERIAMLKQDNKQLTDAVQFLLRKKS